MAYRYYENWTAEDKAVLHREDCGHCSYGKGCHENPLGEKKGRWSQSFDSLEAAKEAAEKTGREVRHHTCLNEDD